MKRTTKFPVNNSRYTQSFSSDESTIRLDGMNVVFDKKITATKVSLNYKNKRKKDEKTW